MHVSAFCISKDVFIIITLAMKGKSKERKRNYLEKLGTSLINMSFAT